MPIWLPRSAAPATSGGISLPQTTSQSAVHRFDVPGPRDHDCSGGFSVISSPGSRRTDRGGHGPRVVRLLWPRPAPSAPGRNAGDCVVVFTGGKPYVKIGPTVDCHGPPARSGHESVSPAHVLASPPRPSLPPWRSRPASRCFHRSQHHRDRDHLRTRQPLQHGGGQGVGRFAR